MVAQVAGLDVWLLPEPVTVPHGRTTAAGARRLVVRPVLVGGSRQQQTFGDVSYCDGVLALVGDPGTATEVITALVNDIALYHSDLWVLCLGRRSGGSSTVAS